MEAKEALPGNGLKPLLMVDIDGVISLFGFPEGLAWHGLGTSAKREAHTEGASAEDHRREAPVGSVHSIDGVPHYLSHEAAAELMELQEDFELVWASGWEEKADEYLPHLLGLPRGLPHLSFRRGGMRRSANAHWKLDAIERHAGGRELAWVDDSFDEECHRWARRREAATLLVQTNATRGLGREEALLLSGWARRLGSRAAGGLRGL
ncbi:MAG TPA: hypothetical protein VMG62_00335 [Solirubrobacteraceae bacterium]|nr:hypothetical protein [Solirubrobacteraceae bacterium]